MPQPRALSPAERAEVLSVLHQERFVDQRSTDIARVVRRRAMQAGLTPVGSQDLRRTAICNLVEAGVSLTERPLRGQRESSDVVGVIPSDLEQRVFLVFAESSTR